MQWRSTILLGVGMVALGTVQAAYATTQGDPVLAALGLVYTALGAIHLWRERPSD